ncbi:hypothetical protein ACQEV4_00210 [Streptomyces shenzhenensis]|uniref:hypothetical protein n=1 Tax=Streptomyces shenzhenensis TaxID=943815 RepID=UPI003D8D7B2B
MALTDITRTEVEKAIEECDRLGRDEFLERYGFRRARRFLVAYEGRHYDSKAIIGAAHGYLPGQRPLMAREFSGGAQHAARLLKGLGFDILEDLPGSALTHDELIDLVTSVKANRSSGAPALYKPITLLWAMGRALRGEPRLLPWSVAEEALSDLLARHGMREEKQRPDYPIASLHREGLWTLHDYAGDVPTAHGDGKVRRWFAENQPRGGLPEPVYDLFRHSALTRLAVIDELLGTFFDGLDPAPLLAEVGLEDVDVDSRPLPTESGPEQWLLTAAEYERGCRLVELREEAADTRSRSRCGPRSGRPRSPQSDGCPVPQLPRGEDARQHPRDAPRNPARGGDGAAQGNGDSQGQLGCTAPVAVDEREAGRPDDSEHGISST